MAAATRMTAAPTSSDRPDGAKRSTSTRWRGGSWRTFSATPATSPPGEPVLLGERRHCEVAEEDDLVLELHPVPLPRPAPRLRHQGQGFLGAGAVGVLDEVRVARRDL